MQKYGFVYIWFDRKYKRYYIGCHWGNKNGKYVCSSSWMKISYKKRPQDFKRKILTFVYTNKKDLLDEEYKWLSLIKKEELGKRYYNLHNHHFSHWTNNPENVLSIKEKISIKTKEAMQRPDIRKKMKPIWENNKTRIHSEEEKQKRAKSNTGQKRTEETKKKIGDANRGENNYWYGKTFSDEHKRKIGDAVSGEKNGFYGKTHRKETIEIIAKKNSEYKKGKKPKNLDWLNSSLWWNNGSINKRSHTCPGKGWIRGRIKKVNP